MPWRTRKAGYFGASLALLALATQLVLGFGHVHQEDFTAPVPAAVGAPSNIDGGGIDPPDRDHDRVGHDLCAICASLGMTSSSVLPSTAGWTTPLDLARERNADRRPARTSFGLHLLFHARAPPRIS